MRCRRNRKCPKRKRIRYEPQVHGSLRGQIVDEGCSSMGQTSWTIATYEGQLFDVPKQPGINLHAFHAGRAVVIDVDSDGQVDSYCPQIGGGL